MSRPWFFPWHLALALPLTLPLLVLFVRGLPHFASTWRDWDVVLLSLVLAGLGTGLTLAVGLGLAALGQAGRVAGGWEALLLLGYLVPPFVTGMGVLFNLGVRIQGVPGILLAWALHYAPLAYLLLKPQVRLALGLLATARVHGAMGIRSLKAFLPPLFPPILVAGGTLYLALLGNFGIPAVLGLPERVYVLPTLAYARLLSPMAQDPLGQAAALGLWLALLALPAVLMARSHLLETREPLLPPPKPLYRLLFALYALAVLALVLLGLLQEALRDPYTGRWAPVFTQALGLPLVQKGLRNSLLLALGATGLLLLLALALKPFPRTLKGMRGVMDIHYLLPGTLLGVGLILLLAPTPLYGTPWILFLAYLLHFSALALRALEGSVGVEGAVLAGRVHGLSPGRAWWRIGYPLLLPSLFAGVFLIFPLAFTEITLSALLYAPGAETVGVAVLSALNGGLYREASALGLVLMAIAALALLGRPK